MRSTTHCLHFLCVIQHSRFDKRMALRASVVSACEVVAAAVAHSHMATRQYDEPARTFEAELARATAYRRIISRQYARQIAEWMRARMRVAVQSQHVKVVFQLSHSSIVGVTVHVIRAHRVEGELINRHRQLSSHLSILMHEHLHLHTCRRSGIEAKRRRGGMNHW